MYQQKKKTVVDFRYIEKSVYAVLYYAKRLEYSALAIPKKYWGVQI